MNKMQGINIQVKMLEAPPAESRVSLLFLFIHAVVYYMDILYGNTCTDIKLLMPR